MYRNDSQNQQERNKWRKDRSESDSYDNNGQEISVSRIVKFFGAGALDEAAQNGGSFILSDDIILEKPVEVAKGKELVLDLNGKTISNF